MQVCARKIGGKAEKEEKKSPIIPSLKIQKSLMFSFDRIYF